MYLAIRNFTISFANVQYFIYADIVGGSEKVIEYADVYII